MVPRESLGWRAKWGIESSPIIVFAPVGEEEEKDGGMGCWPVAVSMVECGRGWVW